MKNAIEKVVTIPMQMVVGVMYSIDRRLLVELPIFITYRSNYTHQ
ncbi:hypothetical protein ymoll0001_39960 [Yersinia mollaretii ATCC 43969]|uniref:Uncharacterized protein n=1 Tax=Yersinia mollaretii (strain ATCC 43969 / DSM 18520 / CIP 103324 / CNY 7263 / WAIP 204) TaxID=349967 RepID=A0ABP2E8K7_YERMW|nr:hypothetical protein ymoll0001_39960 [Yersinia mollaretii ATCC 43969]